MEHKTPHKYWYITFICFWFIPGIICYFIWRTRDEKIARKQLWDSVWIGFFVWIVLPSAIAMMLIPLGLVFG